ncbi:MAG: exodeoxyribonuclease V subunit beta [candidate division Zixibacteria bacterium]|nr:exodeoxyribonuclease V subunit beta [candidate division Zixibacteria bacterium]
MREFDLINVPLRGANLIEASAGTGKTYAISGLFIRLILEQNLSVNEILAVTFTKAAAEELRGRIREKIKDAIKAFNADSDSGSDPTLKAIAQKCVDRPKAVKQLESALRNFDEAAIFTIHGFCQRILHENAFECSCPFDTELAGDQNELKQEVIDDFWREHFYSASGLFVNYAKKDGFEPDKLLYRIGRYIDKPTLTIIPKAEFIDTERLEKDFRNAFSGVLQEWKSNRGDIESFLNDKNILKNYREEWVKKWLVQLDDYLNSNGTKSLFDKFDKFTITNINDSLKKNCNPPNQPFFQLCDDLLNANNKLQEAYNKKLIALKIKLFDYLNRELALRKKKQNIQHYDDLLTKLYNALQGNEGGRLSKAIRKKYKAALIDEFQDTDPIQYYIFSNVFGADNNILFLIGDPKQAIYGFRGADIFAYLQAVKDADTKYTLLNNWRAEPDLIKAANAVFSNIDNPFLYSEISFNPASAAVKEKQEELKISGKSEPPLQLWYIKKESLDTTANRKHSNILKPQAQKLISRAIAGEISRLLSLAAENSVAIDNKPLKASDIAVLVRTNREALIVSDALNEANIPNVLYTEANIFDSFEAIELERVINAVVQPSNERLLRTALSTDMMGLSGERLYDLSKDDSDWESRLIRFREYHERWNRYGFFRMIGELIDNENIRSRLLVFPDGERRLTNLLHLAEILNRWSFEKKAGMNGLAKWFSEQIGPGRKSLDEHQIRLESDDNAVKIATTHKSKGLEYPVVFCPFTWSDFKNAKMKEFIFHDAKNNYNQTLDLGSSDSEINAAIAKTEILAENLRLLYVALTRAKNRCYIVWGNFNEAEYSAMAYFLLNPQINNADDLIAELKNSYNDINDEFIISRLEDISADAGNTIAVKAMPKSPPEKYISPSKGLDSLTCRKFSGTIAQNWRIASFSYLVSGSPRISELPDHDSLTRQFNRDADIVIDKDRSDIFAFPKGAKAGTFIHEIFEQYDFASHNPDVLKELIQNKLDKYGFEKSWNDTIYRMINRVISAPLGSENNTFNLSQINNSDRLNELEFYFPLKLISIDTLPRIFAKHNIRRHHSDFPSAIDKLRFSPVKGFMKGFIDLVFVYNNRYYLVDWKSNHLGSSIDDYNQDKLMQAMNNHYYLLQYHIYAIALNKYLSLRVPDYNYKKHFGGVYYLFIRGINESSGSGIFYDLPSEDLISELSDSLFVKGNH